MRRANPVVVPLPCIPKTTKLLVARPLSEWEACMQKTLKVLRVFEDSTNGAQVFQIHEQDPQYKIDRIVYREKSPYGWFKEITSEDYLRKVKYLRPIIY
jgi:hypothetical protein